jgi:hypothetical protein
MQILRTSSASGMIFDVIDIWDISRGALRNCRSGDRFQHGCRSAHLTALDVRRT